MGLADALARHLAGMGLSVPKAVGKRLVAYAELAWTGNERARLTGAVSLEELVTKHLVDCATLWLLRGVRWDRWIDVGSGAGLPGMVLALGAGDGRGALLEATAKKAAFLRSAVAAMGLEDRVEVVQERAEDWGRGGGRERYAVAVARAVAPARVLAEYLLPLVEVGGRAVMMKGPRAGDELAEAHAAMEVLGAEVEDVVAVSLPEGEGERRLVVLRKTRPTEAAYPRRPGVPAKRPL
ncbi:16S rRNA methyltransferase [Limnochorda pilosa]|uniref:Ribosomal RNA small subunit methyltransferase G n=2 Tax=Limnochorda pilosa TaxID=1555112 RepID=A0A0K2SQQ1_LIMPI|nr:16S rRNA methyltransferase [Limnochorda pilosa]